MNQWKRVFFYLTLNVFVSAITVVLVLFAWDRTHPRTAPAQAPGIKISGASMAATATAQVRDSTLIALASTPTGPASPTPLQNVKEYRVKADDTLGEISRKYGVSVEDLMNLNGLKDPNAISAGLVLYIPITPEAPLPSNTPRPTQALVTTGTASNAAGQAAHVVINSVIGAGDITSERVFLTRTGPGVLSLAGWKLQDQHGNVFVFPQLELFEGGAVNVWTTAGTATVVDLYWGLQNPVWRSGEKVTLLDGRGNIQATFVVP